MQPTPLIQLYQQWKGHAPANVSQMTASGSNRIYYRLTDPDGSTTVGVIGTSREENHAFVYLAQHFRAKGLRVPQVLAVADDEMCYLQTDLGEQSLFDAIAGGRQAGGRYNQKEKQLLSATIRELPRLQVNGATELDWNNCYPQPAFDADTVRFDLNYFKYCFLKPSELDFHELKLEASFRMFAQELTAEPANCFMYRDFQARNVMIDASGTPSFIDFQGGRRGPYYYDIASFLWQASAKYPFKLRRQLVNEYYQSLKNYIEVPSERHFVEQLTKFVLFRLLQVLGAYGFRGYFERKQHFIDSIPPAIQNLRDLLQVNEKFLHHSYLTDVLQKLTELPQFAPKEAPAPTRKDGFRVAEKNIYAPHAQDGPATFSKYDGAGRLTVRVYSFSYGKGIPQDDTGHGGGYVFDCRSTHNPGRYEPYKKLTGLDEPVIRFLEDDGEILIFLDHVYALADSHVKRYLERGFTDLMFCFGCTGGQHRSVYSAQHLAEHLNKKFNITVRIIHREQHIEQTLPAREELGDEKESAKANAQCSKIVQAERKESSLSLPRHRQSYAMPNAQRLCNPREKKARFLFRGAANLMQCPKQAMIFAAGLGTRLRPLTDHQPKALVKIDGQPMLWHVIQRLKKAGFERIVINVHHFAQQIIDYVEANNRFGIDIRISDEREKLLDTGGGIKKAVPLFDPHAPVLFHNVDIKGNADLNALWQQGLQSDAALLVSERDTSRYLLFDEQRQLVGWTNIKTGEIKQVHANAEDKMLNAQCSMLNAKRAFSGIHVMSPACFPLMDAFPDKFGVIDFYLKAASQLRVVGVEQNGLTIKDMGKLITIENESK